MPKLSVDVLLRPSTPCVLLLTPAAVEFAMVQDKMNESQRWKTRGVVSE